MKQTATKAADELRECAMGYPDVIEDHPWGESAFKVNKKVFLFMSMHEGKLGLSVKLPKSRKKALKLPFAEPTGYGLGKSGWVSARFEGGDAVPVEMITDWIDESFRAIAPKKLVAYLDDDEAERAKAPAIRSATKRKAVKSPARP